MSLNASARRTRPGTARPSDLAGTNLARRTALAAASSSAAKPLDATVVTPEVVPSADTSISSVTTPCSPRARAPAGYSGLMLDCGRGGASILACFGAGVGGEVISTVHGTSSGSGSFGFSGCACALSGGGGSAGCTAADSGGGGVSRAETGGRESADSGWASVSSYERLKSILERSSRADSTSSPSRSANATATSVAMAMWNEMEAMIASAACFTWTSFRTPVRSSPRCRRT